MSKTVDALDVKIMKSLSEDCRKSTTQVAREAGTSRPTAIARIRHLSESQVIDFGAKINLGKLGLKLASIHFETGSLEGSEQITEKLRICPRVVQLFQLAGKSNFTALIYVEDAETLISSIDCLESYLGVKISSYQRILPLIGQSFSLNISVEKCSKAPCGKECSLCLSYKQAECAACPSTAEYRGQL